LLTKSYANRIMFEFFENPQ